MPKHTKCQGFTLYGAKIWNQLPIEIREVENSERFKEMVKRYIWENIPSYQDFKSESRGSVFQSEVSPGGGDMVRRQGTVLSQKFEETITSGAQKVSTTDYYVETVFKYYYPYSIIPQYCRLSSSLSYVCNF